MSERGRTLFREVTSGGERNGPYSQGTSKSQDRNKKIASAYGTSVARNKKRRSASEDRRAALAQRAKARSSSRSDGESSSISGTREKEPRQLRQVQPNRPAQEQPAVSRKKPRAQVLYSSEKQLRQKPVQGKRQRPKRHVSAEQRILDATKESRTVNESDENTLDYDALSGYIDELKTKLDETNGGGGVVGTKKPRRQVTSNASRAVASKAKSKASASLSVHQISKVKKRIFDALSHEEKVEAMLRSGNYKPSSNLMKGGQPARKKHVAPSHPIQQGRRRKSSSGNPYGSAIGQGKNKASKMRGSGGKNQWGEWLDEFEAKAFKWFERCATYVRPGPASGKLERAFCAEFPDASAAEAGDPYASLRSTIILPPRRPSRKLKPGQRIRKKPKKVQYGRDCKIRNDGR